MKSKNKATLETVTLTLPDGKERAVPAGTPARDVVASIGPRLLKDAIAVEIDGAVQDLTTPIRAGGSFRVLTERDPKALDVLRHSGAHVLATAVRRLRPGAKIGFGPAIDDGFYYDFEVAEPFTPDDLDAFEAEMRKVAAEKYPFVREELSKSDARGKFSDDPLKLERLEELGDDEIISVYTNGPFVDLCRGPHLPATGRIRHFKLTHGAGAYWRGDSRRQMLQRIYGTAWYKKADLDQYLHRLEEAAKRDHRVLGKQLDLFSIQEDVGPGLIFWHPKGAVIQFQLRRLIEDECLKRGYDLVYTPHITREDLFR